MAFLLYPSSKRSNNRIKLFTFGKDQTRLFSYVSYLSPSGTQLCSWFTSSSAINVMRKGTRLGITISPEFTSEKNLQESVKEMGKV